MNTDGMNLMFDIGETIEHAAKLAHEVNRTWCACHGDNSQLPWDVAPNWQRESAKAGVRAILENLDITPKDLHASWMKTKIEDGWSYGPVKDAGLKTHPCLVAYEQLDSVQRAKDYLFGTVVRAALL